MGIFKRDKNYYIRINNKCVSTYTSNKKVAYWIYRNILKDLTYRRLNLILSNPASVKKKAKKERVEIKKVFEDYIETSRLKNFTKYTLTFKENTLRTLLKNNILYFDELNQENINRLLENIKDYSSDTQRKYVTEICAFLNNCIKKGIYSKRDFSKIEFPKFERKSRDLIITDNDMKTIFDYCKKTDIDIYFYIYTLYNTFSRPTEVKVLEVDAFDFDNRTANIYQNKTKKTKKVYLYKDFCEDLKKYIEDNGITNRIFKGGQNTNKNHYGKRFKSIIKKLKLNPKYNLYTFRHTSITNLLNKTNDIEFVAKQAGNNPEIAMKHYVNRNDDHYKKMMEKD